VIYQDFQKINTKDILDKKFYPVWFFTNERIKDTLKEALKKNKSKSCFGIGGGGDFVFSLLSMTDNIRSVDVCDLRQLATITIDIKRAIFSNFSKEEAQEVLRGYKKENKEIVYKKIENDISGESREVLKKVFKKGKSKNFIKEIKESGYWYKDSFWQVKNKKEYLPYFYNGNYNFLKKQAKKINIYYGDILNVIKEKENEKYDLIYISNILDSNYYCKDREIYIKKIREKLKREGVLVVVTQKSIKNIKKILNKEGFEDVYEKRKIFNLIDSFLGHYCYSFLFFRKEEKEK